MRRLGPQNGLSERSKKSLHEEAAVVTLCLLPSGSALLTPIAPPTSGVFFWLSDLLPLGHVVGQDGHVRLVCAITNGNHASLSSVGSSTAER